MKFRTTIAAVAVALLAASCGNSEGGSADSSGGGNEADSGGDGQVVDDLDADVLHGLWVEGAVDVIDGRPLSSTMYVARNANGRAIARE